VRGLQPLVISSAYGLGQVVFVALDLDRPPLVGWEGRSRLLARLLRQDTRGDSAFEEQQGGKVAHVGYTDLAGQLRSALDQFTGVSLVPFYWVAGLMCLYLVLIGPGDFFFLRRVIGRMACTWLTFPLLACAFSLLAVLLFRQVKLDQLRVNQVDLLDWDLQSSQLRGTTWADVYSPHTETYDLDWSCGTPYANLTPAGPHSICSWLGLPGSGLGGLNTTAAPPTFTEPYTLSLGTAPTGQRLNGTPIQVASTKSFQVRWWARAETAQHSELWANADGLLQGRLVNPLPVNLSECLVLYSKWVYRLESEFDQLEPGAAVQMGRQQPLDLEWRLTRRRVEETREVNTPWDQNDLRVPRILEMMMFHAAAGGDQYTQLTHRYHAFTDLSAQLHLDRAVLLGRAEHPVTGLSIDGQPLEQGYDQRWTFCRVVLPVLPWRMRETAVSAASTQDATEGSR
jgi:hypothetical protein